MKTHCGSTLRGAALLAVTLLASAGPSPAATPSSGRVSEDQPTVQWTGTAKLPMASADCGGPSNPSCDNFSLEIVPPPYDFQVEIVLTPQLADDWDMQVYGPDGALLEASGNAPGQLEQVILSNPAAGVHTVAAAPYAPLTAYSASATIRKVETPPPPPPSSEAPPTYSSYTPPAGMGTRAGEPTLGVDEKTGAVMYIAGLETLRVRFDDCASPARAAWEDVSFLLTSQNTLDPILFTDQPLGRTFASQLAGKTSLMAFSDDDGETWTPSQGAGFNSGVDHQGIGGGPFAPGLLGPLTSYPNAVYYCSQDIALAECALSLDGGLTFGPAVPIYNLLDCGGLHGHPKVGPDGNVYVPNKGCNGEQAVVRSTDSGLTWAVLPVPGSTGGEWDPSVALASDGTVYFGFADGDGHPKVAVSQDGGETWSAPQDVGLPFGIQNTAFPVIVAGDPDRAAFAFLGTDAAGAGSADDPNWPGVWYLYVAHTYDGGATWVTSNATPGDPVQRGTVCAGGINCGTTRNLLDFMDVTADKEGRVLVAYADGCVGGCVAGPPNSFSERAAIARQVNGKRLYAANDAVAAAPAAPAVDATWQGPTVLLGWSTPADNGSAITGYRVYRRTASTAFKLIARTGATVHSYTDKNVVAGGTYLYQVKAVNGYGEGPACSEVAPVLPPPTPPVDTCTPPGASVVGDASGEQVVAALDVESVSVAEPYFADGTWKLTFTVKVRELAAFTAGNAWVVLWNRPTPDATADRSYVAMRATGPGTAAFKHGRISPPSVNQATDLGDADGGSFSADGTITLTLSASKAEALAAGTDLSGIEVRTFAANVSGQPVTQATAADFTASGSYTLAGNADCGAPGAPVARDDAASTFEGKSVRIEVLENDSDPDGDPLRISSVTIPENGKVAAKTSGRIGYTPNKGFTGTDTFTYTVTDGKGGQDTATVTVTVKPR
ncbi:MAG: cadherin-like domain-containing protein [Acidobacteria bacterium]|nr:cadherin-like domain-containing protein [Acidobacteriota bacterium]